MSPITAVVDAPMLGNRLLTLGLLLLLGFTAQAASIDDQKREVERIRHLKFLHDVKVVTVPRSRLP